MNTAHSPADFCGAGSHKVSNPFRCRCGRLVAARRPCPTSLHARTSQREHGVVSCSRASLFLARATTAVPYDGDGHRVIGITQGTNVVCFTFGATSRRTQATPPPARYCVIGVGALRELFERGRLAEIQAAQRGWVDGVAEVGRSRTSARMAPRARRRAQRVDR